MRKQIPADKTKKVVEFSQLRPDERLAHIRHGLEVRNFLQAKNIQLTFLDQLRFWDMGNATNVQ
jgi:hypothetical protein